MSAASMLAHARSLSGRGLAPAKRSLLAQQPHIISSLAKCNFADMSGRNLPIIPQHAEELGMRTSVPIEEAKALHPAFYVDADYTLAEQKLIFGNNWFAAAHTAELAKPGDVKVIDMAGTSIILTRCKKHKLHAFYNVCRHRGAKVAQGSTTNCKQLVCPYHWWAYRLDGTLKATPPAVTPKERKENLSLQRVPGVATFAGMVFLNQTPSPPPLSDVLGDLPEKLARYDLDEMEYHGSKEYEIKGDWKLIAENFVDFYHINAVHPALSKFSRVDDHKAYQGRGQYIGFVTEPLTNCGSPGDSHHFNHFPRINKVESSAALFFQIFPNVSLTIYPHSVYTLMTAPGSAPGRCKEQLSLLMAPGARKSGEATDLYSDKKDALMNFVTHVNEEDVSAIENLQMGLFNARSRDFSGEFLPEYDWPIHRFQNMVLNGVKGLPLEESIMPVLSEDFSTKVVSV